MSEKDLEADEVAIETPMDANELMVNFLKDIVLNEDPNLLASDFIDEFVLQDKPETSQILAMFEIPTENLIEMVKGLIEESYQMQIQSVNNHGFQYLEGLKAAVKTQMTEIAEG